MKILLLSLLLLKTDQTNFIERSTDLMDQGLIIVIMDMLELTIGDIMTAI